LPTVTTQQAPRPLTVPGPLQRATRLVQALQALLADMGRDDALLSTAIVAAATS
jgi:hypothetical protein